jgi:basic membrane protein A
VRTAAALASAAVAPAAAVAFTASGSAPAAGVQPVSASRLVLVLPGGDGTLANVAGRISETVRKTSRAYRLQTRTVTLRRDATGGSARRVAQRIAAEGIGIAVVLGDGPAARSLAPYVRELRNTRFVFLDASLADLALQGAPNAAALRFSDEETSHLVGYMSGLSGRRGDARARVDTVSVVAGTATPDTRRNVAAFAAGVRRAAPRLSLRIAYAGDTVDPTACERLANRHIDAGADVVFAVAGRCGLGALAVARYRGVWGVGANEDGVPTTDDLLAVTHKEWDHATFEVLLALLQRTLPMGRDVVRGLADDYAVGIWMSAAIPAAVQSAVIDRCSQIRAGDDL